MVYEYNLIRKKVSDDEVPPICNGSDVVDYALRYLYDEEEMWREKCWAIFLNKARVPSGHFLVSVGGSDSCQIDVRNVIEASLYAHSSTIVLVHNHPSGNPYPSQHDIQKTDTLRKALAVMDMTLLDHVVIGEKTFFSFTEELVKSFIRMKNKR